MRAIFCNLDLESQATAISITGDRAHHLQVIRLKINEEILVLNGKGARFNSQVISISKKEIVLKILKKEESTASHRLKLAVATPKKDAFEDILKMAVELGVESITPLTSIHSQFDYNLSERTERLLESALIQSNNAFLPEVRAQITLDTFLQNITGTLVYFSSTKISPSKDDKFDSSATILIGPEAGFSKEEEDKILSLGCVQCIHLPTPILRAPTAVATSIGYLLRAIS